MRKRIDDPTRPEGFYYGYESAADCLADYDAEAKHGGTRAESVVGYSCLWIFLAAIVVLSVIAGLFQW